MKKQLQQALKVAVLLNAKNEITQLHRKIRIYRKFIQMKYFETLKLFFETTVDLIKNEIRKTINESSQLNCIGDSENFSSNRSSSSLLINFASMLNNFFFKILKTRSKSKKIEKTLNAVKQKSSIRQTTAQYEVNRQTVFNQISKRHAFETNDRKNRMLLTIVEKTALLRFVNQFVALEFPFRLSMLTEKAVLLLRQRNVDQTPDMH